MTLMRNFFVGLCKNFARGRTVNLTKEYGEKRDCSEITWGLGGDKHPREKKRQFSPISRDPL